MHNIYHYLNNPVEIFFLPLMKKYNIDGYLYCED